MVSIGLDAGKVQSNSNPPAGGRLAAEARIDLSVQVLAGTQPVSRLADLFGVSRKTAYQQADTARLALEQAFDPATPDDRVLFQLPVTKAWLRQFVLAGVLIGHASYRGVGEMMQALLDLTVPSPGTIHNIVQAAADQARQLNAAEDLAGVRVGAHDEIYQAGRPVLVGVDVKSLYNYLLVEVDHVDETTWGLHLLDLAARGLAPDYTVADGGKALRAGQRLAWPTVPCHGDVFHADMELGKLAGFLEHQAATARAQLDKLRRKMKRVTRQARNADGARRLGAAEENAAQARDLATDVRELSNWLTHDILALAGPSPAVRLELFDFLTEQLGRLEPHCAYRIGPVRSALLTQRDDLLAFSEVLDERYADLAEQFVLPLPLVRHVAQLDGLDPRTAAHWQARGTLLQRLGQTFAPLQRAVREAMADTARASSLVENLNSRLRCYFFLRRDLGDGYLELLRFFLNHRPFRRSESPQRVGKTPAELLTGRPHAHWLELLGFQRFHQN
jgi:hypothetical protein